MIRQGSRLPEWDAFGSEDTVLSIVARVVMAESDHSESDRVKTQEYVHVSFVSFCFFHPPRILWQMVVGYLMCKIACRGASSF